jgi:ATP-binding cassette subfamily C (CFTR/MRP) protein 1
VSTVGSSIITRLIGDRQEKWSAATEERLAKTSSILSSMKGIKMMGLGERISDLLQEKRITETNSMRRYNWVMVWMNIVGELNAFF